jgi:hypothetical protein
LDRVTCVSVSHATGLLEQEEEEEEKMNGFRIGDNQIEAQHRHISESQQDRLEAVATFSGMYSHTNESYQFPPLSEFNINQRGCSTCIHVDGRITLILRIRLFAINVILILLYA